MNALQTSFSTVPSAYLAAVSQQIMGTNIAVGKGIVSGLVISPGTGLNVNVSAGTFTGQVEATIASAFVVAVPASYSGYLYIQATVDGSEPPDSLHQTTTADPGATYVCLGHFTTSGSVVTSVDPTQAQIYGGASTTAVLASGAPIPVAGGFGVTAKTIAGSSVTLSATEGAAFALILSGTPGAARNVVVPNVLGKPYAVVNGTDSTVTVKTPSGTGVAVASGKSAFVLCDGTNVVRLTPDA